MNVDGKKLALQAKTSTVPNPVHFVQLLANLVTCNMTVREGPEK